MHIHVPQKDLEIAATAVANLAERSTATNPVLANVLVEATDQGVQFRGTDNESMVTVNVEARVERKGATTIPADTFREIVKYLPAQGEVSLEDIGGKVVIRCETNEFNLMTAPAEDFPQWQMEAGESKFQVAQKTLRSLIDSTVYALPVKDHRRVLMGIYMELFDNEFRMTATDGKKLSRIYTEIPEIEGKPEAALILPRKLAENVLKQLGSEGPVEVELSANQVAFRFANITYRGMGIDGKYPDCNQVIPKEFPIVIGLNRDVFLQAARRAGITSDDKNKSIILQFDDNRIEFHSMHYDLGTFSGSIPIEYAHERIELAFNYQFLIETLTKFPSPEVRMFIKSQRSPVVFRNLDDERRLCLLMPIKLSDVPREQAPITASEAEE